MYRILFAMEFSLDFTRHIHFEKKQKCIDSLYVRCVQACGCGCVRGSVRVDVVVCFACVNKHVNNITKQ